MPKDRDGALHLEFSYSRPDTILFTRVGGKDHSKNRNNNLSFSLQCRTRGVQCVCFVPFLLFHWRWKCVSLFRRHQNRYTTSTSPNLSRPQLSLGLAALNYPLSRGTATAFPLAAFGLSAFLFSTISSFAMADNTADSLLLLAIGTLVLPIISFFFLRVASPSQYSSLPTQEPRKDSQVLGRTGSGERHRPLSTNDLAARTKSSPTTVRSSRNGQKGHFEDAVKYLEDDLEERSSLLSKSSTSSGPGDLPSQKDLDLSHANHESSHLDIRGFALLPHAEFWQLFLMMGLLTGIGLMTIKYEYLFDLAGDC